MNLGETIRQKRLERKLSQEYVADQLGISRQAVSKWETGQSEPTASNLVELAALLDVSLSDLTEPQPVSQKQPNLILRRNLMLLAIGFQAGSLYSCTQIQYIAVGGELQPDYAYMIVKLVLLLICSVWMAWNHRYEPDPVQRRKNSRIECLYCCIQFLVAMLIWRFHLGLVGLALIAAVVLIYVQIINPKYMNRHFEKSHFKEKE